MAAAAAAEAQTPTWDGKATEKLLKSTPDKVWSHLQDFCGFGKWLPTIDTCYKVNGADGQRGLVRYCSATLPPAEDGGEGVVKWCREELVDIDPVDRRLTYEVLDNNMGFGRYRSTLRVVEIDGGDGATGCEIEWSFVADPIEGLSYEDMVGYIGVGLRGLAVNLENGLSTDD